MNDMMHITLVISPLARIDDGFGLDDRHFFGTFYNQLFSGYLLGGILQCTVIWCSDKRSWIYRDVQQPPLRLRINGFLRNWSQTQVQSMFSGRIGQPDTRIPQFGSEDKKKHNTLGEDWARKSICITDTSRDRSSIPSMSSMSQRPGISNWAIRRRAFSLGYD